MFEFVIEVTMRTNGFSRSGNYEHMDEMKVSMVQSRTRLGSFGGLSHGGRSSE
jgi:hypothetical protein